MDDLNQQINQILSDPESMKQIQDMMGALGLTGGPQTGGPQTTQHQTAAPPTAPVQAAPITSPASAMPSLSPEMLQMATRMAPLLGQINREDDSTRLLRALRPLLSPPRQKKLDEAIKILHMMRLMPLLKDSGLFSGLLSSLF